MKSLLKRDVQIDCRNKKKGLCASEYSLGNPGITCFKCGKAGHIARNCRAATQGSVGGSASQGPATSTARARTFKITKRSNAHDSDVVVVEFLGFPPNREIEFSIDLVPGVEPVSKTLREVRSFLG
ncbi:hypothetical protein AgCh_017279 [Apium graveolens]